MSTVLELAARHAAEQRDLAEKEALAAKDIEPRLDEVRDDLAAELANRDDLRKQIERLQRELEDQDKDVEQLEQAGKVLAAELSDHMCEAQRALWLAEGLDGVVEEVRARLEPSPPAQAEMHAVQAAHETSLAESGLTIVRDPAVPGSGQVAGIVRRSGDLDVAPDDGMPFNVTDAEPALAAEIVRRTGGLPVVTDAGLAAALEDGSPLTTRGDLTAPETEGPRHAEPKGSTWSGAMKVLGIGKSDEQNGAADA